MDSEEKEPNSSTASVPGQPEFRGQIQPSGAGRGGDEKRRSQTEDRGGAPLYNDDRAAMSAPDYNVQDTEPGGSGKQGDQQELGKERPQRKDKSHDEGGSDKLHAP
jgi:hypothetical protein